jgi:hypothetical protein
VLAADCLEVAVPELDAVGVAVVLETVAADAILLELLDAADDSI